MLCDSLIHSFFLQTSCNSCEILGLNNHILQPHPIGHMLLDLYSNLFQKSLLFTLSAYSFQKLRMSFQIDHIIS